MKQILKFFIILALIAFIVTIFGLGLILSEYARFPIKEEWIQIFGFFLCFSPISLLAIAMEDFPL